MDDEARGADALASFRRTVGLEKLNGLLRLRVARPVGVIVVEEASADIRSGAADFQLRRRVVLVGQNEQELREREIRSEAVLAVDSHSLLGRPIGTRRETRKLCAARPPSTCAIQRSRANVRLVTSSSRPHPMVSGPKPIR